MTRLPIGEEGVVEYTLCWPELADVKWSEKPGMRLYGCIADCAFSPRLCESSGCSKRKGGPTEGHVKRTSAHRLVQSTILGPLLSKEKGASRWAFVSTPVHSFTDRIKEATDAIRAKLACATIEARPAKGIADVDQYRSEPSRRHAHYEHRQAPYLSAVRFAGRNLRRRIGIVQWDVRSQSG